MTDGVTSNVFADLITQRPRLYQSEAVREVQARARFLEQQQSNQERQGIERLNRLLVEDAAPDRAVPRGFYLNIEV